MMPDQGRSGVATKAHVTVRDGRVVQIRAVSPDDEAELLQKFERSSDHERYMRFMRVVRNPDRERLHSVLASFPESGIGVVATTAAADGVDIVGSAIAVFDGDRTGCEFAVSVDSSFAGVGLATTLMTTLIDEAKRRGLKEMEGFVLTQNQSMLRLARRLGFSIKSEPGDPSVRVCHLNLLAKASGSGG